MYVIGTLEEAITTCFWERAIRTTKVLPPSNTSSTCLNCYAESVRTWDRAVALYTGSLESDSRKGIMLYHLSDKKCIKFRTCGPNRDSVSGISYVNLEIFSHFSKGQMDLSNGRCEEADEVKNSIMYLMQIPLIQGTLYYAYLNDRQTTSGDKENVIGAVYAASILPLIHQCNVKDSKKLWEHTAIGTAKVDFLTTKALLERNYECLKITCADVGGIFDPVSFQYYEDASPCTYPLSTQSHSTIAIVILVIFSIYFVCVLLLLMYCCCLLFRRHWYISEMTEFTLNNDTEFIQGDESDESEHSDCSKEGYRTCSLNNKQGMVNTDINKKETCVSEKRISSTSKEDDDEEEIHFDSPNQKSLGMAFEHSIV
jgi:hypothetical protein